jgi:hypothetical protein
LAKACFNQNAAKTAQQLVVVVVRKDLWRKRAQSNLEFLENTFKGKDLSYRLKKRKKIANNYYRKLIPTVYTDFLGIMGWFKYLIFQIIGLFRPIYRQVRPNGRK